MRKTTKKKTSRVKSIIIVLLLSFSLTGCFGVNENFELVKNDILNNFNGKYSKNIEYGFGSITLGLAEMFVSFSGDEDAQFTSDILDEISGVQIGIYEAKIQNIKNLNTERQFLKRTIHNLVKHGWNTLVLVVKHDNMTAVLSKENEEQQLQNMFVLNISDNKLMLVELSGNLDKIIDKAIQDDSLNFDLVANN